VPWHLPFHRTEAARAARVAKEAGAQGGLGSGDGGDGKASDGGQAVAAAAAAGTPKIDAAKGAVVFQRYYHLFEKEELVGLVEEALAAGPEADVGSGDVDMEGVDGGDGGAVAADGIIINGAGGRVVSGSDGHHGGGGDDGGGRAGGVGCSKGLCVPYGVVEDVFYDRSNWCIVFRRAR
ncbi:hypothetical protein Vretimale_9099, partial [Volvox reticuliferus]